MRFLNTIPFILTVFNLLFGFISIVFSLDFQLSYAAISIMVAIFFDIIDGRLARILKISSNFGEEFDSLADIVSFGVAPGILIYTTLFKSYGLFGIVISSLIPICSAIRLARFNIQKNTNYFSGLPTPTSAGIFASMVILNMGYSVYIASILVILISYLMISNVRYPNFKNIDFNEKVPLTLILLLLSVVPSMFDFNYIFLPFVVYLIFGLFGLSKEKQKV